MQFINKLFNMADEVLTAVAMDISKLKVQDLKKELKMRGLTTTGNKTELIERLQGVLKSTGITSPDSVDDLEEDLLNDDDDEHLDASESILENELDDSPKSQKRKLEDSEEKSDDTNTAVAALPPPKKVILNRNTTIEPVQTPIAHKETENKVDETSEEKPNEEKKIIKLSQLSAKERLEMRAKKFGVTAFSDDAKKLVRAERFGTSNSSTIDVSGKTSANVDVLKQRAQRFGGSVSSIMSTLENKEKLEKRKERFGATSTTNGVTDNEKAKQRLERFKQPVK